MSAIIPLTTAKGALQGWTVVDHDDLAELRQHRWYMDRAGYAVGCIEMEGERLLLGMHRYLLGLKKGDKRHTDHINRIRNDNRRCNLRIVTNGENKQNVTPWGKSSKYRGVCWHRQIGRWQARGKLDGVRYQIGTFATEDEAGEAAAAWRAEHHPFSEDALKAA